MIVKDVMQELADQLDTIAGLRVYGWAAESVTEPAAVVGYPEITFDATYGRGMDEWQLPVWAVVAKASNRGARESMSGFASGGGIESFKAVLDGGSYTSLDVIRVASATPDQITVGTTEYLAYRFDLEIVGQGA
jgi:hypothetical protein